MKNNPIIIEFLNTSDSIEEILQKHYCKDQYLENIFLKIAGNINYLVNYEETLATEIDQAVLSGHPDNQIYTLFISHTIFIACELKNVAKANSLYSIALSLPIESMDKLVQAYFLLAVAKFKYFDGKAEECKSLINQSIPMVDANHPRYVNFYLNWMSMFGGMGQLIELNPEIEKIPVVFNKDSSASLYLEAILLNCIMTCNCSLGLKLIGEYRKKNQKKKPYVIEGINNSLKIISGDFEETSYHEMPFKIFATTCKYLSLGDIDNANKEFQLLLNIKNWQGVYYPFLSDYFPIQLALNARKSGLARFLLLEKSKNGEVHYLDDLFHGRLQLLENELEYADKSFSRLTENINRYGAQNRLAFELQFAKEIKLPQLLRLLKGWESENKSLNSKAKVSNFLTSINRTKGLDLLIGRSPPILHVKDLIKKYAKLKAPVLITGETGTGKELASRAIHDEGLSPNEPFLVINCGTLTDNLLQSELFGYEAGAFTGAQKKGIGIFEAAGKGTVFLDEFGDISPKLQASLLRVLENNEIRLIGGVTNRTIECKIVVATNVNLHQAVIEKKFREDLYFRLARFEIKLPSLRERLIDISELINHFLLADTNGLKKKSFSNELLKTLTSYHWPGNIRELKSEIERLCVLNPTLDTFDIEHLNSINLHQVANSNLEFNNKIKELKIQENSTIEEDNFKNTPKGLRVKHRQELILKKFLIRKILTKRQIMEITKVGSITTTKDLQTLIAAGYIVRRKPTKSTSTDYFEIEGL